jgi:hypothetical protein
MKLPDAWDIAQQMCEKVGLDLAEQTAYYQRVGIVVSMPHILWMAEPIMTCCKPQWQIALAIGKGSIPMFLQFMPFWLPYFSFARFLRQQHNLRTYPMERVCALHGIDTASIKLRTIDWPVYHA